MSDARSTLTVDEARAGAPTDATVLAVAGELDLATIATLREAVATRLSPDAHVVLDLSGLTFCDSTGLGGFVALHRQARSTGARLAFAAPRKRIADLFALSGIDQVISVFRSPDEAVAAPAASTASAAGPASAESAETVEPTKD